MFEYLLLKQLLSSEEFFSKVIHLLKGKYFKDTANREVFKLLQKYYQEYNKVPSISEVVAQVKDVPNSELRKEIAKSLKEIN